MSNNNANLRVRISADLADIKQGLAVLRGDMGRLKADAAKTVPDTRGWEEGLKRVRVAALAAGAALVGAAAAAGAAVRSAINNADDMSKNAQRVGLTTEALSELAYAAKLADVDINGLKVGLRSFNQEIGKGGPELKKLGIDIKDAAGNARPTKDILLDVADVIASMPDGANKAALAMKLFGSRAGAELIPLFNGGSKAIRQAADEAQRFGQVISTETGRRAEQFNDNMTRLKSLLQGVANGLMNEFLPGMVRFSEQLVAGAGAAGQLGKAISVMADIIKTTIGLLDDLLVLLISIGVGKGIAAIRAATAGMTLMGVATKVTTGAAVALRAVLATIGGPITLAIAALTTGIYMLYRRTNQAKQAADEHNRALAQNRDLSKASATAALDDAKAKRQQAYETLKAARAALEEARVRLSTESARMSRARGPNTADNASVRAFGASVGVRNAEKVLQEAERAYFEWGQRLVEISLEINDQIDGAAGSVIEDAAKKVADSNALLRDSIARELAALDRLYADHEIGITRYFQQRRQLQEQAIDAEIAQARMQLAVAEKGEARRKIEEDIIKLQRDRAEVAVTTARDERKALDELSKSLDEVYLTRLENEGKLAQAARARLEEEFRERIVRLQAEGRDEEVRTIRLHIDAEAAKAQLSQFENAMTQTLARLQAQEQTISAQQQAGLLGYVESERQIKDARVAAMEQLQQLRADAAAFLATLSTDNPAATKVLDFLRQLDGEVAVVSSSMQRFRQQIADTAIDAMTNAFMGLVDGTKTAGEALKDFVRDFALGMAQIAARALATFLVLQMLDAVYPGLGKATAAMMQVRQYHGGGTSGSGGGVRRWISPMLLGEAPRYHNGRSGLKNNEELAVLEAGETVRTKQQEAALAANLDAARNGGGARVTTPVVALGEAALANALAGQAGRDMVITHVRENWDLLAQGNG